MMLEEKNTKDFQELEGKMELECKIQRILKR